MPDEPKIMTSCVPRLSRQGQVYMTPVSLPFIGVIVDLPRYQKPADLAQLRSRRDRRPRLVADERALESWHKA
jgi:hypothetical protein